MSITTENFEGGKWFKISNYNAMRPFFMSIVSDSNHWMFISSNGGLTAGRKNSEFALFPYYTDDTITESFETTGSKTIIKVQNGGTSELWEPFSERCPVKHKKTRNLYKNFHGNKILFEEINHHYGLIFRYQWNSSNLFGFVRKAEILNQSGQDYELTIIDGIQNILPFGVDPDVQVKSSNLVDAYKRSELIADSGMAIYALSAIIVDKAEPSEALKANVAWSTGLENPQCLLSSLQLNEFREGRSILQETDVKGEKGAYFVKKSVSMPAGSDRKWTLVANVNQNHAAIAELNHQILTNPDIEKMVDEDIQKGTKKLHALVAGADGLRKSRDHLKDARHFSNVLFNIMRGGTFDHNYRIEKHEFTEYLRNASRTVYERNRDVIADLKESFSNTDLYQKIEKVDDPDLFRLCYEYLPLKFSRRHGDPSRPWNQFSINTHSEKDGSKILDYEGNWRDIFQNWEALAYAYPGFIEGMVFKFLNNSTFDGYNPYRITKSGFDWETIEPDNPWSYIGYWGDHQIIYLLKFLEFYQRYNPDALSNLFDRKCFVYANVPYRIAEYSEIAEDPQNTITFNEDLDQKLRDRVADLGADGALLTNNSGAIHRVNFLEKILATVLAKISNFVPEAGIWLTTQRPEWNDANNALVGNGASMITLCYLRRFLKFFVQILKSEPTSRIHVSKELSVFFNRISTILSTHEHLLNASIDKMNRKAVTDALGEAGSDYRLGVYNQGFSGEMTTLGLSEIARCTETALKFLEHSIQANRREDNLFHSYNLISYKEDGISVSQLYEMLEGQVAVLSSGYLAPDQSVLVLDALKKSALFREDQNSYLLYPDKDLPGFLEKNNVPQAAVENSELLSKMAAGNDHSIIQKDIKGKYHFNGNFRNASDVKAALRALKGTEYSSLAEKEKDYVLDVFEKVFHHKAFTGRSGTFFSYEGLGSIYWHMVSKLHLAVAEVYLDASERSVEASVLKRLYAHFRDIGDGIGIHKSPELYGAYPTDPYSHTPKHRGAQQPGMTGQVKEDILVSIAELGVTIEDGALGFTPKMLARPEFTATQEKMEFIDVHQHWESIHLPQESVCFSICQVPVIYEISDSDVIHVAFENSETKEYDGLKLDSAVSSEIFMRTGNVKKITVFLKESHLNP